MNSMSGEKLKGIPYTGTLPAVLAGTKAGYLHRYKIYGNLSQNGTPTPENPIYPSECGERTENLANDSVSKNYTLDDTTGQPIPATSTAMKYWCMTQPINVMSGDTICLSVFNYNRTMFWKYTIDDGNENVLSRDSGLANGAIVRIRATGFMRIAIYVYNASETYMDDAIDSLMLTEGSTAPDHYIPNGYKLPLLSGSTPVDIYIGDDTLSTEEYVDSGTGKIYRMVDSVLTPVDPPVPFPQIPTTANSTTISWAGQGLAPSEFDSVQEWVDIPTYKRVNGEWVEDN